MSLRRAETRLSSVKGLARSDRVEDAERRVLEQGLRAHAQRQIGGGVAAAAANVGLFALLLRRPTRYYIGEASLGAAGLGGWLAWRHFSITRLWADAQPVFDKLRIERESQIAAATLKAAAAKPDLLYSG